MGTSRNCGARRDDRFEYDMNYPLAFSRSAQNLTGFFVLRPANALSTFYRQYRGWHSDDFPVVPFVALRVPLTAPGNRRALNNAAP